MISHSFTHFLIQSEPFTRNSHGKCEFLTVLFVNEFCGKREPRRIRWSDTDCQESFCRKALLLGEEYNFRSTGSVSVNTTQESTMYSLLQFTLTFDLFLYLLMCISCSFTSGDKKKILFIFSWERELKLWIQCLNCREDDTTNNRDCERTHNFLSWRDSRRWLDRFQSVSLTLKERDSLH